MFKLVLVIMFGFVLHSAYLVISEIQHRHAFTEALQQLFPGTLAGEHLTSRLKLGEVYRVTRQGVFDGKKIVSISPVGLIQESAEIWTHEFDLALQPIGTRFKLHRDGNCFLFLGNNDA